MVNHCRNHIWNNVTSTMTVTPCRSQFSSIVGCFRLRIPFPASPTAASLPLLTVRFSVISFSSVSSHFCQHKSILLSSDVRHPSQSALRLQAAVCFGHPSHHTFTGLRHAVQLRLCSCGVSCYRKCGAGGIIDPHDVHGMFTL